MNSANGFPDLLTILVNLSTQIGPILSMMQGIAALIGLFLITGALIELWGCSNDGASKYMPSHQRCSVGGAIYQLITGGIFTAMGTLEWMGIMSRTITSDYANSRYMSYSGGAGTLNEQAQLATQGLMGILQMIGFVAMCKGWLTIDAIVKQKSQQSLSMAIGWILGGVLCWNFQWFASVTNNSIGFQVIRLFPGAG